MASKNDYLFTPDDEDTGPVGSNNPDGREWKSVGNDGMFVDATEASDYKRIDGKTTLLPYVAEYGGGLPGKTHPFGDIVTGTAWEGNGVKDEKAPIRDVGKVEPATRAWEAQAEHGIVKAGDAVTPKSAELSGNNDEMLKQITKPKYVLKYKMSGEFGVSNGNGEMISISPDDTWLGLVYSDEESVFTPVADHDKEISLTAAGQTYSVRFTGIVLPIGEGRNVMVFYKQ